MSGKKTVQIAFRISDVEKGELEDALETLDRDKSEVLRELIYNFTTAVFKEDAVMPTPKKFGKGYDFDSIYSDEVTVKLDHKISTELSQTLKRYHTTFKTLANALMEEFIKADKVAKKEKRKLIWPPKFDYYLEEPQSAGDVRREEETTTKKEAPAA